MAFAPLVQAAAPYAQQAGAYLARQSVLAARYYVPRYVVPAATAFTVAADASRWLARRAAIMNEHLLSDEEYSKLGEESQFAEERCVRVCYQTIRLSRDAFATTGISSPVGIFAHWCLEIDGIYYELREYDPAKAEDPAQPRNRLVLHEELGSQKRKIKLEVSTGRTMHESTQIEDVGMTRLSDERIISLASRVFARFGDDYDLWLDNCQHFSQLLAEAICGREARDDVRKFFEKRSVMKLPAAASWLATPVYFGAVVLHHGAEPGEFKDAMEKRVQNMEKYILHPRVYASRRALQFWK